MDTNLNNTSKKILMVEVQHLNEVGYGPHGTHTREAWRKECLKSLLWNKYEFTKWQQLIISEADKNLPEVSFGCLIFYSDGSKVIRGRKYVPYSLDFFGVIFEYPFNIAAYTFSLPTFFSYSRFNSKVSFTLVNFESTVNFVGCQFNQHSVFFDANFNDEANFSQIYCKHIFNFEKNKFFGEAIFSNSIFNEKVTFDGTKFEKQVNFSYSVFNEKTSFKNAVFLDVVSFERIKTFSNLKFLAIFNNNAIFRHAKFNGVVSFGGSSFNWDVTFYKAHFDNRCHFNSEFNEDLNRYNNETIFKRKIDFENAIIENTVNFERVRFNGEIPSFLGVDNANARLFFSDEDYFKDAKTTDDSIKYLALLKRISDEQGQTDQALMFNALELQAKAKLSSTSIVFKFITFLYKYISDFGRSFVRPMIGYLSLLVLSSILVMFYSTYYERPAEDKQVLCNSTKDQLQLKLSYERAVFEYAMFRAGGLMDFTDTGKQNNAVNCRLFEEPIEPPLMRAWGIFKGIASIALLFLAALGLRNKYRIK